MRRVLAFCAVLWSLPAFAELPTPPMPPASPELEARLKKLDSELRCPVCQNQTLADSPAMVAGDLRREVRLLAEAGKSDEEIKTHLRARYGDFVLYRPVIESKTYLLWFGPFVLLLGGGFVVWLMARNRRLAASTGAPLSQAEAARARALLEESAEKTRGALLTEAADIGALLRSARVIAVVGLSSKTHRPSHEVSAYMQAQGYRIIPVNPRETEVLGERCYSSLTVAQETIAEKIDIVDCFRKAEDIGPIVEEAIAIGARSVWMQLGIANPSAAERALAAGLDVVMDRCIKVDHLDLFQD